MSALGVACGPSDFEVGPYVLVSSQRITRTEFDFTYRASISNRGADAESVTATVLSSQPPTTIVDGELHFDLVPGGETAESVDTFTIRQDRTVPFDPNSLRWTFSKADTVAPVVELFAPTAAAAGSSTTLQAVARDDVGVVRVVFSVDGVQVSELFGEPYKLVYNAPAQAGDELVVKALAFDAAGNEGEASVSVVAVSGPDLAPPVIESVLVPPTAAPGARITVRAIVTDDRGVSEVRFFGGGVDLGADSVPPYEVNWNVPASVPIGQTLQLEVQAVDISGLTASTAASLVVEGVLDRTSPSGVSLSAPVSALPGQKVTLAATAVDAVGVMSVFFSADGVQIGEDAEPPFELSFSIPHGKKVGSRVLFVARASDFSGNQTQSSPIYTRIGNQGSGFVVGEVYNDLTGLPLADAGVRLLVSGGVPNPTVNEVRTDARGRYRISAPAGPAALRLEKDGFTSAHRMVDVVPDLPVYPLDARLTPLADAGAVSPATASTLRDDVAGIEVRIPAGALPGIEAVTVTNLSGQGLPAPLPLGWSPVAAVHLGPDGVDSTNALEVDIDGIGEPIVAVRWDASSLRWVRSEALFAGNGHIVVPSTRLSVVALARPDELPAAPATPPIGVPIEGVAVIPIPGGATAQILPSPTVLFLESGARSQVTAVLSTPGPLPSGTPIETQFTESYHRTDGSRIVPEPWFQDLLLYQAVEGPSAAFPASPSQIFDAALLEEGKIRLDARFPTSDVGSAVLGPAGGTLQTSTGLVLEIPSGALSVSTPVELRKVEASPTDITSDPRFDVLASIQIDLGDPQLTSSAVLRLSGLEGVNAGAQVLLVRADQIADETRLVLAARTTADGATLQFGPDADALPTPGVSSTGLYHVIAVNDPIGFIAGSVRGQAAETVPTLIETPQYPFVGITPPETRTFALAAPIGQVAVVGQEIGGSGGANVAATLTSPGEIAILELVLGATRPQVVSTIPADGTLDVALASPLAVRFSRALDPPTITPSSFVVDAGGAVVSGSLTLAAGQTTIVFTPSVPLADSATYTIRLLPTIADTFGNQLLGNEPDEGFRSVFTTVDKTPPAPPDPGQVSAEIPIDEFSRISGAAGATAPATIVTVINQTSGTTVTTISASDGSFRASVQASIHDEIVLILRDSAGNTSRVSPGPYRGMDGSIVVGEQGAIVSGPGGVEVEVPAGAFKEPTAIRVLQVPATSLGTSVSSTLQLLGMMQVEMGSARAERGLNLSIPAPPGGVPGGESAQILVLKEVELLGSRQYELVNVARVVGDRIQNGSPQFEGAVDSGSYAFALALTPLAFVGFSPAGVLTASLGLGIVQAVGMQIIGNYLETVRVQKIYAVPKNRSYTLSLVDVNGSPITTRSYPPLDSDFTQLRVGPPGAGPLEIADSLPANGSSGIEIDQPITVVFNQEVDAPTAVLRIRIGLAQLSSEQRLPVEEFCSQVIFDEAIPGEGFPRAFRCRPRVKLNLDARYRIDFDAVCPYDAIDDNLGGACTRPFEGFLEFHTVGLPSVASLETLFSPNDVTIIDDDLAAISNGSVSGYNPEGVTTGAALVALREPDGVPPTSRLEVTDHVEVAGLSVAIASRRSGQLPGDSEGSPIIVLAGGRPSDIGWIDLFSVELAGAGTGNSRTWSLLRRGRQRTNSSLAAQLDSAILAKTPPYLGFPRDVFLLGSYNAYIANTPPGVQAIDLEALAATGPTINVGLFPLRLGDRPAEISPISIAATPGAVFASTTEGIFALDTRLTKTLTKNPFGGASRALLVTPCVASESENGVGEPPCRDFLLAGQGDALAVIDVTDVSAGKVTTRRVPLLLTGESPDRIDAIRADWTRGLAYLVGGRALYVVDLSVPVADCDGNGPDGGELMDCNGDGSDDRVIGRFGALAGARGFDVTPDGRHALAAFPARDRLELLALPSPHPDGCQFDVVDPNPGLIEVVGSPPEETARVVVDESKLACDPQRSVGGIAADGVTRVVLRCATPSRGRVEFSLEDERGDRNPDQGTLRVGSVQDLATEVNTQDCPGERNVAAVVLTAPLDFARSPDDWDIPTRRIVVKTRFTNVEVGSTKQPTADLEQMRGLDLHRPPVVLMHGINSGGITWNNWSVNRDARFIVHRHSYRTTNFEAFRTNVREVPLAAVFALDKARRRRGIAATQVDYVGHSMGGLLGRLYVSDKYSSTSGPYRRATNYFKGDLHKLLTLSTPHLGAPLAAPLAPLGEILERIGFGALNDLRPSSDEIATLPAASVPSHALVADGGAAYLTAVGAAALQSTTRLGARGVPAQAIATALWLLAESGQVIPLSERHDLIVPVESQEGRLSPDAVSIPAFGLEDDCLIDFHEGRPCGIHTSVTAENRISDYVIGLLNARVSSSRFDTKFPGAVALRAQTTEPAQASSIAPHVLSVASPQPGSIFDVGDTVTVDLEPPADFAHERWVVISSAGSRIAEIGSYRVELPVPLDLPPGDMALQVFAFDQAGELAASSMKSLIIRVPAALEGLSMSEESLFLFEPDPRGQLEVAGRYNDGIQRDLTSVSAGTTYRTSNSSICTVSSEGVVTGMVSGTCTVTAENSGKFASTVVVVDSGSPTP
jgi:pimeloyl-ACP methyl ester carboxylesterase